MNIVAVSVAGRGLLGDRERIQHDVSLSWLRHVCPPQSLQGLCGSADLSYGGGFVVYVGFTIGRFRAALCQHPRSAQTCCAGMSRPQEENEADSQQNH